MLSPGVDRREPAIRAARALAERGGRQIDAAGIASESHLAVGRTVEEIIKLSREFNATMIVMGRTGKDWFQEYWLGGVSHQVAELSELPVLLIP